MAYTKTNWQNDTAPAINATNLNHIEDGIFNNDNNISNVNQTLGVNTNTWNSTTLYGEGDVVIYDNTIYRNISGTSTTTNPKDDTTNWDTITIFDTDSINNDLIDKTEFINNSLTNSNVEAYSCNYINGLNTYSTSEQRIGTWIDGKPIYRKVINDTTSSSSDQTMLSTITNLDYCISMKGILVDSGYSIVIPSYVSSNNYTNCAMTDGKKPYLSVSNGYRSKTFTLIIEYTKTTD